MVVASRFVPLLFGILLVNRCTTPPDSCATGDIECSVLAVLPYSGFGVIVFSTGPITINGDWDCSPLTNNCQDVYDFRISSAVAADSITISVSNITGTSVLRMAVFGPGSTLNATNLINSGLADHRCFGQDVGDSVSISGATGAGLYRIAIGRDWGLSAGSGGLYTLAVSMNAPKLAFIAQTADNAAPELLAASTCP